VTPLDYIPTDPRTWSTPDLADQLRWLDAPGDHPTALCHRCRRHESRGGKICRWCIKGELARRRAARVDALPADWTADAT